MKKSGIFVVLLFWIIVSGCSRFTDIHYFKDKTPGLSNYYKVEVKGSTLFSSSRYVSGYYDKNAVLTYFGEISQPKKGKFIPTNSSNENKELVLLLSTNSDAIANSIGNIVKSQTVANSLVQLVNKDKIEAYTEIDNEVLASKFELESMVRKIDSYLVVDTVGIANDTNVKNSFKILLAIELYDIPYSPDLSFIDLLNKSNSQ